MSVWNGKHCDKVFRNVGHQVEFDWRRGLGIRCPSCDVAFGGPVLFDVLKPGLAGPGRIGRTVPPKSRRTCTGPLSSRPSCGTTSTRGRAAARSRSPPSPAPTRGEGRPAARPRARRGDLAMHRRRDARGRARPIPTSKSGRLVGHTVGNGSNISRVGSYFRRGPRLRMQPVTDLKPPACTPEFHDLVAHWQVAGWVRLAEPAPIPAARTRPRSSRG